MKFVASSYGQCDLITVTVLEPGQSSIIPHIFNISDTASLVNNPCPTPLSHHRGIMSSNSTLNDHWYLIMLKNNSTYNDRFLIELDNSQTDYIDLYKAEARSLDLLVEAGDQVPFAKRNTTHRNIIFPLDDLEENITLLVNVKNRGSYGIPVKIYEQHHFEGMDSRRDLIIGMYLGLVLIFILGVASSLILADYNHTHLYYLLYLIFAGLYFFAELGFADIYFWPHNPNLEEPFLFIFILGSAAAFLMLARDIFQIGKGWIGLTYIFRILVVAFLIALVSVLIGLINSDSIFVFIYYLILIIVGLTFLYAILAGVSAIYRKVAYAKYFLLAFSMMIIGAIMKPASLMGLIPYSSNVYYGGIIGQSFEIISLSTLLVLEFFNRMKYATSLETKVVQLEKSALQAQMNPHFIFNCLNSIQNYIAKNEKVTAMEYLSKFAKLIRKTLNASASKKISLTEEIDMLEGYLELEQLRFKKKFDYTINVDNRIDVDEVLIPPLMIQPFAENAIIHGFKGIDRQGSIIIEFNLKNHRLEINIKDNGTGIQINDNVKTHKSMAMGITRQRITHLNQTHSPSDLTIAPSVTGEGTEVKMYLDIENIE